MHDGITFFDYDFRLINGNCRLSLLAYILQSVHFHKLTLCCFKSLIDGACGTNGCAVNAPVEEQHHEHWQIEGSESRIYNISGVVGQLTRKWTRLLGLLNVGVGGV